MAVELQDRPENASFWKRVLAAPALCFFGMASSHTKNYGQAVYYWRRRKAMDSHVPGVYSLSFGYTAGYARLITAVYLPVESLRRVDLVLGGQVVATWTPDQPVRGISLETILSESRRIPHGPHEQYYYQHDYRPSPEIEIWGQTYRRVVLYYPGISQSWYGYFFFYLDKCESFEFFQEELVPPFPTPKVPCPAAMRSDIPKQLLASPKWAVPALLTESLSPSLTTSMLPRS